MSEQTQQEQPETPREKRFPYKVPARNYQNLLMLFSMASVPFEDAAQLAREFENK